jgi:hypothetical protein
MSVMGNQTDLASRININKLHVNVYNRNKVYLCGLVCVPAGWMLDWRWRECGAIASSNMGLAS